MSITGINLYNGNGNKINAITSSDSIYINKDGENKSLTQEINDINTNFDNRHVALYDSTNIEDPNTTLKPLILASINVPIPDSFYYVQTYFYSSQGLSQSAERTQTATGKSSSTLWTRYFKNSKWSEWIPINNTYTSGRANIISDPYAKCYGSPQTGMLDIKIGNIFFRTAVMITIKGHLFSYNGSTDFEASTYLYCKSSTHNYSEFLYPISKIQNKELLKTIIFAKENDRSIQEDGYIHLLLVSSNETTSVWAYPSVFIEKIFVSWSGYYISPIWYYGWNATTITDKSIYPLRALCVER